MNRMFVGCNRLWKIFLLLLVAGPFFPAKAIASESIFAWTYTTDTMPKGKLEFEQWMTPRWKKEHGTYQAFDFREELEYGITDYFQTAFYLNHRYAKAKNDVPVEDPNDPGHRLAGEYETGGEDVHDGHDPSLPFETYHFESVSLEFIYRILSPYKDILGLALYFEPSIGPRDRELEWKILLHKTWLDDQLVWAGNINYALGWGRKAEGDFERDGELEFFTGLSYRFMSRWSAALEFWNHHEFARALQHEHSAYFVGPTIHYGEQRWWISVGFLHQLPVGEAFSDGNRQFAYHDGYIFGNEHEKYYIRVKVGVNF